MDFQLEMSPIDMQRKGAKMKKIVIIDALNLFIRNYVVNPTMDDKGISIGGCIGFLKSLQKIS